MRILSVLAFRRLVSYGIRRGATTGGRSAAAHGAEGDGAPRAPGVGGMGGVEMQLRARQCPITPALSDHNDGGANVISPQKLP